MFCKKCGMKISDSAVFCNNCGEVINNNSVTSQERWESKVVQVVPSDEDETIEEYELFGWELLSSQTIDRKDSHLENRFGDIYSVTESVNYVKLTFRRNIAMKHYQEYSDLETKYRGNSICCAPTDPGNKYKWLALGGIISCFIGLLPIGLPVAIFAIYKHRKETKEFEEEYERYRKLNMESEKIRFECLQMAKQMKGLE